MLKPQLFLDFPLEIKVYAANAFHCTFNREKEKEEKRYRSKLFWRKTQTDPEKDD